MQRRDIPAGEKQYDIEHTASREDVDSLIETLQSDNPTSRRTAALNLGALGEWRAVDPLIQALNDPVQDVREGAANALVMVGTPAVEPLIALLDRPGVGVPREPTGHGLTQIDLLGGPEGIPPEKRRLQHGSEITQHDLFGGPADLGTRKSLRHRELAQHNLLGGPEDAREHERLFPGARRAGVVPEGVTPGTALRRAYAAIILGEIADPRAEGALDRALSDSNPRVQRAAEDGMVRYQQKRGMTTQAPPAPR